MEFRDVISARRSVRAFDPDAAVDPAAIEQILQAACSAPSARNGQPWRFLVATEAQRRGALARAAPNSPFVAQAPVILTVCADVAASRELLGARGPELLCIQDVAIATGYLLLAAAERGLGACWVGGFNEAEVVAALALPGSLRPMVLVPIGHPAADLGPRSTRRPLAEVVTWLDV